MMESQPREIERFLCGGDKSTQQKDIEQANEE
jgi:putative component of toxin-antitoxin plasmid stabilization module